MKNDTKSGYLYAIRNKHYPSYIKVGRTKDISQRLHVYNNASPEPVMVLEYLSIEFYNVHKMEEILLERLGSPSYKKEWFKESLDTITNIIILLEGLEEDGVYDRAR